MKAAIKDVVAWLKRQGYHKEATRLKGDLKGDRDWQTVTNWFDSQGLHKLGIRCKARITKIRPETLVSRDPPKPARKRSKGGRKSGKK